MSPIGEELDERALASSGADREAFASGEVGDVGELRVAVEAAGDDSSVSRSELGDIIEILNKARHARVQNEEMERVRDFIRRQNNERTGEDAEVELAADIQQNFQSKFGIDTENLPPALEGATGAQLRHLYEALNEDRAQMVRAQSEDEFNSMVASRVGTSGNRVTGFVKRAWHGQFRGYRETGLMQNRVKALEGGLLLNADGTQNADSAATNAYLEAMFDRVKAGGDSYGLGARRYTHNDSVNVAAQEYLENARVDAQDTADDKARAKLEADKQALDAALRGYADSQSDEFEAQILADPKFTELHGSKTEAVREVIAAQMARAMGFADSFDVRNRVLLDQATRKNEDSAKMLKELEEGGFGQRLRTQLRSSVAADAGKWGLATGIAIKIGSMVSRHASKLGRIETAAILGGVVGGYKGFRKRGDQIAEQLAKESERSGEQTIKERKKTREIGGLRTRSADSVKNRLDTLILGLTTADVRENLQGARPLTVTSETAAARNAEPFVHSIEQLLEKGAVGLGTGAERAKNEQEIRDKLTQVKNLVEARKLRDGADPKTAAKRGKVDKAFAAASKTGKKGRRKKQWIAAAKGAAIGAGAGALGSVFIGAAAEALHDSAGDAATDAAGDVDDASRPDAGSGATPEIEDGGVVPLAPEAGAAAADVPTTIVGPDQFIQDHESAFTHIKRNLWYDNDTPAPNFDLNELRLKWGGSDNTGIDASGNVVMNVKDMTKPDSFHDATRADAPDLLSKGELKLMLSLSQETQNDVVLVDIDPATGNAVIDVAARPELQPFFSQTPDGKAVFNGRFAEVVHVVGQDKNGNDLVNMLATHEGDGVKGIEVPGKPTPEETEVPEQPPKETPEEPYIPPGEEEYYHRDGTLKTDEELIAEGLREPAERAAEDTGTEPLERPERDGEAVGERVVPVKGGDIIRELHIRTDAEPDAPAVASGDAGVPTPETSESWIEIVKQKNDEIIDSIRAMFAGRPEVSDVVGRELDHVREAMRNDVDLHGPLSEEEMQNFRTDVLHQLVEASERMSGSAEDASSSGDLPPLTPERAVFELGEQQSAVESILQKHPDFEAYNVEDLGNIAEGRGLNYFRLLQTEAVLDDVPDLTDQEEALRGVALEAVRARIEQVGPPEGIEIAEQMWDNADKFDGAFAYLHDFSKQDTWNAQFGDIPRISELMDTAPTTRDIIFHYDNLANGRELYDALAAWSERIDVLDKSGSGDVSEGMRGFKESIDQTLAFMRANGYGGEDGSSGIDATKVFGPPQPPKAAMESAPAGAAVEPSQAEASPTAAESQSSGESAPEQPVAAPQEAPAEAATAEQINAFDSSNGQMRFQYDDKGNVVGLASNLRGGLRSGVDEYHLLENDYQRALGDSLARKGAMDIPGRLKDFQNEMLSLALENKALQEMQQQGLGESSEAGFLQDRIAEGLAKAQAEYGEGIVKPDLLAGK